MEKKDKMPKHSLSVYKDTRVHKKRVSVGPVLFTLIGFTGVTNGYSFWLRINTINAFLAENQHCESLDLLAINNSLSYRHSVHSINRRHREGE